MLGAGDYIEKENDVKHFLSRVRTILSNGDDFNFIIKRDRMKNKTTLLSLFYDSEDVVDEVNALTTKDYLKSAIDTILPSEEDYRVFVKTIKNQQIYIKIKIQLNKIVFCISFHFAERHETDFPYA